VRSSFAPAALPAPVPAAVGELRAGALAAAAVVVALVASGCSAETTPSATQQLTVSYRDGADASEATSATIEIPALRCFPVADSLLFQTTEPPVASGWRLLSARATSSEDSYILTVQLDDSTWFITRDAFGATEKALDFESVSGIVSHVEIAGGEGSLGDAIDTQATLSGVVNCTE